MSLIVLAFLMFSDMFRIFLMRLKRSMFLMDKSSPSISYASYVSFAYIVFHMFLYTSHAYYNGLWHLARKALYELCRRTIVSAKLHQWQEQQQGSSEAVSPRQQQEQLRQNMWTQVGKF